MSDGTDDDVSKREFASLKKLAKNDFPRFAIAVQHRSEAVQLKLIEQMPELTSLGRDALGSLQSTFESALAANEKGDAAYYAGYEQTLKVLLERMSDPDLPIDEMLRLTAEVHTIQERVSQKNSESKAFINGITNKALVAAVAVVGIVVLAVAGGKLMIDGDDTPSA